MSLTTVAISGVSSEVGKTTLLCKLLREFPEWEAIKRRLVRLRLESGLVRPRGAQVRSLNDGA
jgi:hypothetical protein